MDSPSSFSHQQRWVIISLIFGACLPLVDVTILGIAIPDLAQSFNVTIARLQWVSVLYTVTATMTVTTCAWATRQIGAKRLWFTGLCLFTVSSLFAAISPNVEILLFSRALQGVGAGIIMAGMQTVLVLAVGKPMLKTAMATMAVPTVLAPIAGPVLAGYLLHIGDWRWIFYINVPIGMIAIALARIKLPDDDSRSPIHFDLRGFMMLAPALLLLMFSLSSLSDLNKPSGHFGLIIGACVFLGVLLLWIFSKYSHQRGEQALVRLSPFQVNSFRASMCLLFFSSAGFYADLSST
ncbi:MFS transporter [Endozoicomonas sp. Mp262]|uniref:MFS transporter n=1 Tax=Endozoicomonas sp. Mp262 TaxID=2919499 RepID=UPI0021D9570D